MRHRANPQRLCCNLPASKPGNAVHAHGRGACLVCGRDWFSSSGLIECQHFHSNAWGRTGGLFTSGSLTLHFPLFLGFFCQTCFCYVFCRCLIFQALRAWLHLCFSLKIAWSLQRAKYHFLQKGNNACIYFGNSVRLMMGDCLCWSLVAGHKQMLKNSWLIG